MSEPIQGTQGVMPDQGNEDPGAGGTPAPAAEPSLDELRAELERTRGALKAANSESAGRRKRLKELETAEEERKRAQMTELEQAKAREAELTAAHDQLAIELSEAKIRHAVEITAAKLNFQDPEDAFLMIDLDAIEIDDVGKITGVDKALKALAKAKPYLIRAERIIPNIDATTTGRSTGAEMSEEEILEFAARYGLDPETVDAKDFQIPK